MIGIAMVQPEQIRDFERGEIERISALVAADEAARGFELRRDPDAADLVVLLDACTFKTQRDIPAYEALVRRHGADRLLCINYEDGPPGFLPGLYSSLERFRYDPELHVSWPHLRLPNDHADRARPAMGARAELLFTFSGACSHPFRRRLFDRYAVDAPRVKVREIKRWYDHDDAEKLQYVVDIERSLFVLCPRGIASYSHRILETLALGRVPVVLADDWVPFDIPEQDWYVRLPESALDELEPRLEAVARDYERLAAVARAAYARHFAPRRRYTVALEQLIALRRRTAGRLTVQGLSARWRSRAFHTRNGWALEQRLARRARGLLTG